METRTLVTDDGAEISYRFRTGRDPWILLHGLGCDARMWEAVVSFLDPSVGVVVPELRGHGASSLGWKLPSVDTWATDVKAIADHEQLAHPAVAGLSMGGYAVLAVASAFPRFARALAAISTSATPDDDAGRLRRAAGLALIRREGSKAFAEALLPSLVVADRPGAEGHRELLLDMFARAGDAGLAAALFALANRPDRRGLLALIRGPVQVVVGDQDPLTPPARAREIAAGIPGARLTVLEGVSHMSALEAPAEVARALRDI